MLGSTNLDELYQNAIEERNAKALFKESSSTESRSLARGEAPPTSKPNR
jgi:hypothetical protein